MPRQPHGNGPDGHTQPSSTGGPHGAGGEAETAGGGLTTTLESILADGGLTLVANAVERLTETQADLADVAAAGGTALPDPAAEALARMADRLYDLATGESPDDGAGAGAGAGDPSRLLDGFSEVVERTADLVSDAMADRLAEVSSLLTGALGDGSVDDGDAAALTTASALLDSAAGDAFVKLSDEGLATLARQAENIETLLTDGFLPFDDAELGAVSDLLATLQTLGEIDTPEDHQAVRDAVAAADLDALFLLGGPGGSGGNGHGHGHGHGYGYGDGDGDSAGPEIGATDPDLPDADLPTLPEIGTDALMW
jgi:hypothetical protein